MCYFLGYGSWGIPPAAFSRVQFPDCGHWRAVVVWYSLGLPQYGPLQSWPSEFSMFFCKTIRFWHCLGTFFFCREMNVYLPCNECKYKFYTHLHQLCSYLSLVRRITFFAVVIFHSYMSYTSQIYLYHSDFWPFFCLGRLTWSHLWNHQSELCRSHYRGETYSLLNNFWLLAVAPCLKRDLPFISGSYEWLSICYFLSCCHVLAR